MSGGFLLTKKTDLFEMDDIDVQITFAKQLLQKLLKKYLLRKR